MPEEQTPGLPDTVATEIETKICDWCGQTFELRKRIRSRRFCSDRCRNHFHTAERRRWEAEALAAIDTLKDALTKLARRGRR